MMANLQLSGMHEVDLGDLLPQSGAIMKSVTQCESLAHAWNPWLAPAWLSSLAYSHVSTRDYTLSGQHLVWLRVDMASRHLIVAACYALLAFWLHGGKNVQHDYLISLVILRMHFVLKQLQ